MGYSLKHIIKEKVKSYYNDIISDYKHFHQHPELSFHEFETAQYICSVLNDIGIPYGANIGNYDNGKTKISGTGILAWIEGKEPESKTIALRADMDALPIKEANEIDFASQNEGVMHACGHDAHTASLLSAARIINDLKDQIRGTILFIFQPGEEKDPGGAKLMLQDGLFDKFKPDLIIGQHTYVDYPVGTVGFESGIIMASADEVHIKIKGKGGHGAIPHELNDTVLAASQVIVSMQQVVSRRSNPFKPMVLSFGKFIADGATNVIPDEVVLAGSLRCMDEDERNKAKPIIRDIAIDVAKAYGCDCEIEIGDGYPCVDNNAEVTALMRSYAGEYLPEENVKGLPKRMTAEDFGFFSQQYPSTFYRFGVKSEKSGTGLHTSTFLIDEKALETSVGLLSYLAVRYCS
ncbi:M20 family metallopeptidase [Dysgonomonas sp. 520]|uniref:M20 metallopeptidase family protein n=1 Tax=Dysgonomonas sp. 520 TaxID=2302931 RepID=UPI0013D836BB|nr:M20 family metallopeptidase [Dysgonomonas sp. 520]NDW10392.1 amidohydrolase [Dysgonomonas sp. 520]